MHNSHPASISSLLKIEYRYLWSNKLWFQDMNYIRIISLPEPCVIMFIELINLKFTWSLWLSYPKLVERIRVTIGQNVEIIYTFLGNSIKQNHLGQKIATTTIVNQSSDVCHIHDAADALTEGSLFYSETMPGLNQWWKVNLGSFYHIYTMEIYYSQGRY